MTSHVIATGRKYQYQFSTGAKLIIFKHILSSILLNNRIIVLEIRQKIFQLQLSTFKNAQLQLQQNRVINYNFVNYNYNFSKPVTKRTRRKKYKHFYQLMLNFRKPTDYLGRKSQKAKTLITCLRDSNLYAILRLS